MRAVSFQYITFNFSFSCKISGGGLDDVSTQSLAMELHHLMAYARLVSFKKIFVSKVTKCISLLKNDGLRFQNGLALWIWVFLVLFSRASKAFNTVQSLKQSGCAPCFTEVCHKFYDFNTSWMVVNIERIMKDNAKVYKTVQLMKYFCGGK